jgi:5-methylcytosine-specific restriction endonuclease McrA
MSRQRVTPQQRRAVIERAQGRCEYCCSQVIFSTDSFSVEHIIPREKGGETVLDNLALSCQGCNNAKYTKIEAKDLVSKQVVPLFHPRKQKWSDHFIWNYDYTHIEGITPTGRATVTALKLNRTGLVNLRAVLYYAKKHPPQDIAQE